MPKSVKVQREHCVTYHMYDSKGCLHNDNGEPAIVHDQTKMNAVEFYEYGERHCEFGGAIRLGNGTEVAYFLRGYEFADLVSYEEAVFQMNHLMDQVQDILDKAAETKDAPL